MSILGACNTVLADGFATQAYIERLAPVLAPAFETGMRMFGQYFLKGLLTGFPDSGGLGGYNHAVTGFGLAGLNIAFSIDFHHTQTAVAARHKVGVGTKRRNIYPGFLGCP